MRYRTLIVMLFCATSLCAAQRTFVSAASGSDANPCTRALPCRSFAVALLFTDPDGEVIVVDSGGYGPVTITQPVSLISPDGIYAGITSVSGNAITVNAGNAAHVVVRNLSLEPQGSGNRGIDAQTVAALCVEKSAVTGFDHGFSFDPMTPAARLYIADTVVRRCNDGIYAGSGALIDADSIPFVENITALFIQNAQATVRDSFAVGNDSGFWAGFAAYVLIENSEAAHNPTRFYASGGVITLSRCSATFNVGQGIAATNSGTIYVSESTITGNATGISPISASIFSRGNNTLQANTTNGAFSNTVPAQ